MSDAPIGPASLSLAIGIVAGLSPFPLSGCNTRRPACRARPTASRICPRRRRERRTASRISPASGRTTASTPTAPKGSTPADHRRRRSSRSRTVWRALHRISRGRRNLADEAQSGLRQRQSGRTLPAARPSADDGPPAAEEDHPGAGTARDSSRAEHGVPADLHRRARASRRSAALVERLLVREMGGRYAGGRTSGFRDGLWADFNGSPLTDRARITERIPAAVVRTTRGRRHGRRSQRLHAAVDRHAEPAHLARHRPAGVRLSRKRERRSLISAAERRRA